MCAIIGIRTNCDFRSKSGIDILLLMDEIKMRKGIAQYVSTEDNDSREEMSNDKDELCRN